MRSRQPRATILSWGHTTVHETSTADVGQGSVTAGAEPSKAYKNVTGQCQGSHSSLRMRRSSFCSRMHWVQYTPASCNEIMLCQTKKQDRIRVQRNCFHSLPASRRNLAVIQVWVLGYSTRSLESTPPPNHPKSHFRAYVQSIKCLSCRDYASLF